MDRPARANLGCRGCTLARLSESVKGHGAAQIVLQQSNSIQISGERMGLPILSQNDAVLFCRRTGSSFALLPVASNHYWKSFYCSGLDVRSFVYVWDRDRESPEGEVDSSFLSKTGKRRYVAINHDLLFSELRMPVRL